MKVQQWQWQDGKGWQCQGQQSIEGAQLVFAFGARGALKTQQAIDELSAKFPNAKIVGCSTSGEILDVEVSDNTISATAIQFDRTEIQVRDVDIQESSQSYEAGKTLAESLPSAELKHVVVFSEGLNVNGSELVRGLSAGLPATVSVSGGLAGDAANFQETAVIVDSKVCSGKICAVGFYGEYIRASCASLGGWDPFGPEREITESHGNVLVKLDGKPALELYKQYLGEHAEALPGSGLLFPLAVSLPGAAEPVVRTILAIDENEGSITFAGDVPKGCRARFMKANFDRLIAGAAGAAEAANDSSKGDAKSEFGLLISCVGRKLVLGQRVEEEVESVREVLGDQAALAGFYSYGEISPFTTTGHCELHNQTMTITSFYEQAA